MSKSSLASITLKKINDKVIKPVKVNDKKETKPIRGKEMFPSTYANIGIIARKKSGKSTVVFNIVKGRAGLNTKVIVFSSTYHKDPVMIQMKKWCKKNKVAIEGFTSMKEGKHNILKTFLDKLGDIPEESEEEESEEEVSSEQKGRGSYQSTKKDIVKMFGSGKNYEESEEESEDSSEDEDLHSSSNLSKKAMELFRFEEKVISKLFNKKSSIETPEEKQDSKYLTPDFIIIFDDISQELKDPHLISFLKKNRHLKCDCILSTQWVHDLKPEQLKQLDYLLLFRGMDIDKLEKIRRDADLTLDLDMLEKLYENATKDPYCFLYIDRLTESYRKCFDKQYFISSNK